jgi:hypothetical protein
MKKRNVLIVSHSDADGHLIAEQLRRNLVAVKSFDVTTVVDPVRTKDHRTWMHLDIITEVEKSDLVFFVDLMFAPASFGLESDALVRFAQSRPKKKFFVIDHHPLPFGRLRAAANVRAIYRPDVMDCVLGPSSWMMNVAARCEHQPTRARKVKAPLYEILATAIRRAAAPGGTLPGEKLATLLRFDRWSELEKLGREAASEHLLPRGRRKAGLPPSSALTELDKTATELLQFGSSSTHNISGNIMPYDFEAAANKKPPTLSTAPAQADDLEAIVMLLELAAIYLTPEPGVHFTEDELLDKARAIAGEEISLNKKDAAIVLGKAKFLRKDGKRLQLR